MAVRRTSRDEIPKRPRLAPIEESPRSASSATAVAAEALRTGVLPASSGRKRPDGFADQSLLAGDPDDSSLANEYVGEEIPGGSTPTPDQNDVDAIGRAYGLQEEDTGRLQSVGDVLARRDRHRSELRPPNRRQR